MMYPIALAVLLFPISTGVHAPHKLPSDRVIHYDAGRLSVYRVGDGHNNGRLACRGQYTDDQIHIAYRGWRRMGCYRAVYVCAEDTRRCTMASVRDAGPFGIYKGKLRRCKSEGRWKVWTKSLRPPKGWKWRGVTDLSWALWLKLGKPRFLSKVHLYFLDRKIYPPRV